MWPPTRLPAIAGKWLRSGVSRPPLSRNRAYAAALAAIAIVTAGCSSELAANSESGGYISADGSITIVPPAERKAAPDIAGDTLEGEPIALDDFAGQIVVINVWGSWCGPCHAEADDLAKASKQLADDNVQFLGIAIRDQTAKALAFQKEYGIGYPSIDDPASQALLEFPKEMAAVSPPTTYVVDTEQRLAARIFAEVTTATLVDVVDEVRGSGDG